MPKNPRGAKRHKTTLRGGAQAQLARALENEAQARTCEEFLHDLRVHQTELEQQNEELRRTQLALETARDRYLDLYDFAPVGYFTLNLEGVILEVNLTGATMLGEERKQLLRRRFARYVAPSHSDRWRRDFMSLLQTSEKRHIELALRTRAGSALHAQLDCLQVTTSGEATVVRIALTDISALKDAQADLRVAATAFESQEAIMITDARSHILQVNRAFVDMTGYRIDEIIGQTPRMFHSGRQTSAFYSAIWENIRFTGAWQGEIWNQRKNGEVYPAWLTITAVTAAEGEVTHYVSTMTDISRRKAHEEEITRLAFYDSLTGLPNRRLMMDRLHQAMLASARIKRAGALMFIDLDHFKTINDTRGHDKGDLLLQQVAQRLVACMRDGDTVARLGGDEFVVMLTDLSDAPHETADQARATAEKILAALNQPFILADHPFHGSASIGIALFAGQENSIDELLKRADLSMYQAKAAGRNALRFYDSNIQLALSARATLESELRLALHDGQLSVHYQPQVDRERRITGCEALVRWQHPRRGLVWPEEFIVVAEDAGLIQQLGAWVLETACMQLVAWSAQPDKAHLTIAVNVSAHQFRHADFVELVMTVLNVTGANPHKLVLELTESVMLSNVEDAHARMAVLKAKGIILCLDDFGTGYSSLSYLKRLPVDQLKLDLSFVHGMLTDPNAAAIVRSILSLGQSMGKEVIAEGIETEAQWDFLIALGCQAFQGYLIGWPEPAAMNIAGDVASDVVSDVVSAPALHEPSGKP
ncbi:MAG: EAL domain-containing protein [Betaproteobacteria bacterium]|nr:EAL domain-containing protein [Betaproteobacteria bacterium]